MSMIGMIRKYPVVTAIITFFVLRIGGSVFVLPTTCRDGWHSSSIGRRGACSWHGGVGTNWSALLLTLISAAAAFALWNFIKNKNEQERQRQAVVDAKRKEEEQIIIKEEAAKQGIACPECGFPLRIRLAKRGRNAGKKFWGCSRYPSCKGTRPL